MKKFLVLAFVMLFSTHAFAAEKKYREIPENDVPAASFSGIRFLCDEAVTGPALF